jgi:hypothetical protein
VTTEQAKQRVDLAGSKAERRRPVDTSTPFRNHLDFRRS